MQQEPYFIPDKPEEEPLLTADEFRALAARVQRTTNRIHSAGWIVFGMNLLVLGIFWLSGWDHFWQNSYLYLYPLVVVNGLETYLTARLIRNDRRDALRMIRFMGETPDAGQLGTILDLHNAAGFLNAKRPDLRTAAGDAVMRLLPLIQSDDADTLNTQQRARLRYNLFKHTTPPTRRYWLGSVYCLPVLSALEQIGDKRDLPDVERLLKADYLTDEIRAAAERCAQTIRERVAREESKDVLLRADRRPEAVETLLRPSIETADTPPQQLLRAATSDDGNTPA